MDREGRNSCLAWFLGSRGQRKQYLDTLLTTSMVGGRFMTENPGAVERHSNGGPEDREVVERNGMKQGMG